MGLCTCGHQIVNQSPTDTEGQLYFEFSCLNSPVTMLYMVFMVFFKQEKTFPGPHCKQRRNCLQGDTDSQKMGVQSVAVYSEADRNSMHVDMVRF